MKYNEDEGGKEFFLLQVKERSFSAFSDEFYEASLIYCEDLDQTDDKYFQLQTEFLRLVAQDFFDIAYSWEKK